MVPILPLFQIYLFNLIYWSKLLSLLLKLFLKQDKKKEQFYRRWSNQFSDYKKHIFYAYIENTDVQALNRSISEYN